MSGRKKAGMGGTFATFFCCVVGVPACTQILPGLIATDMMAAVAAGVLLGVAYLMLRPVIRVLTLPIGCLTFGLFNAVIDVALLYGCAHFIEGFEITSVIAAIGAALIINAVSAIVGGFK